MNDDQNEPGGTRRSVFLFVTLPLRGDLLYALSPIPVVFAINHRNGDNVPD